MFNAMVRFYLNTFLIVADACEGVNHKWEVLMTHKYRGSIVVLSISKSVEPNKEQKEMTSSFQQGILCKH